MIEKKIMVLAVSVKSHIISLKLYKQPICDALPQSSVLPVIRLRGRQGRVGRTILLKRTRISGKFQYWRQPFNVEFQKCIFWNKRSNGYGHILTPFLGDCVFVFICQITEFLERCPVSRFSHFYTTLLRWEWSWTEAEITIPPKVWTHQPG